MSDDLKARVRNRLETIKKANDAGYYARHYVEDVSALLAALEEASARNDAHAVPEETPARP